MRNMRWGKVLLIAPLAILGMALFAALGGYLVMRLWNWLLPPLFAWQTITFWQALGLLVLCRLLFGGMGFRGGPGARFRRRMQERWEAMTPEERERARQRMGEHFGFRPPGGEGQES